MAEQVNLGFRALWEPYNVFLELDMPIVRPRRFGPDDDYDKYSCPHVSDNKLPRVVIGTNEGGYNSVGICADCLIEALGKIKGDVDA